MRKLSTLIALLLALLVTAGCHAEPPLVPTDVTTCSNEWNGYHLKTTSPVIFNQSSYALDLDAWNNPDSPVTLRASGLGFPIRVIDGEPAGALGLASISVVGKHIQSALVTMNHAALDDYPSSAGKHVLCQEVFHTLGLDHTTSDMSCMNDCAGRADWLACITDPLMESPDAHDFAILSKLYAPGHDDAPPPACSEARTVLLHSFPIPGGDGLH